MIKIVADTLSCLSVETARDLDISYLPQIIIFASEEYRDDSEIDSETFLSKLKSSPTLPKTAAPAPALYTPIFKQLSDQGHTILVICPSASLSGTLRSAEVAAQDFPNADIHIIDTRTIGANLGSIVLEAHRWAKEGKTIEEILAGIRDMMTRARVYFLVDTLEYLHKGGRIGGAKALLGTILQVKPILTLNDGVVEPFDSQRTKLKAVNRLKELVYNECASKDCYLSIMHGGNLEEAQSLANEFSQNLNIPKIPIYFVPPAILVHGGPGVLAAAFFAKS